MTSDRSTTKKKHRPLGPHSRLLDRGTVNGRSREGRFLAAVTKQLTEHVGGAPSAAQRMLISRLARVSLRLELFDEKMAKGETISDHDARVYGALHNTFRLMLRELGLKGSPPPTPSLAERLARGAPEKAAAAQAGGAAA